MKTTFFARPGYLFLYLVFNINFLAAQVSIGSTDAAVYGALLDIKEKVPSNPEADNATSKRGLAMPRVTLSNKSDLDDLEIEINGNYKEIYIGLTVYNISTTTYFVPGLYTWSGEKWILWKSEI